MKILNRLFLSSAVSIVISFLLIIGATFFGAGGGGRDLVWLFFVIIIPIFSACMVMDFLSSKLERNNRNIQLISAVLAFFSVTISGVIFAPIVQSIQHGYKNVNVSGYIEWAPVYGLFLLPFSFPIALTIVKYMWNKDR